MSPFQKETSPFKEQISPKTASEENTSFWGPHHPIEEVRPAVKLSSKVDRAFHAWTGKLTTGMSPASLILAYQDWLLHLSAYPAKQQDLLIDALLKANNLWSYALAQLSGYPCAVCIEAEKKDDRFQGSAWRKLPFALYAQNFLLVQEWWKRATSNIHGVSKHHTDIVSFMTRQWLDMLSPSNFLMTNPEVLQITLEQRGKNLLQGLHNALEDLRRLLTNAPARGTEKFRPGHEVATCEGKVVYRNSLFELIQYAPCTDQVLPEPILIAPAWIMKYYILDLSPENSMVKYLLEKGHTVFMISWKNPTQENADWGMRTYLKEGILQAIEIVSQIVPSSPQLHGVGYCIGGTLYAIAAAFMAHQKDPRLKTLTLFTTQLDFEEAGELLMFIDESQLAYLEDLMWEQGFLEKWQVSGAFNMLRSKDLIWSRMVREYLKGEEGQMFDLMAWNTDATRLPYRVHSTYLRRLYLNNDLAEHRYDSDGVPIYLENIKLPVFAIATKKDHIAPWKSVFKLHTLLGAPLTFVLTSGGHNAGIVSEPGHKGRSFQIKTTCPGDAYQTPEEWMRTTKLKEGSWWSSWHLWLKKYSGAPCDPPSMGAPEKNLPPLDAAPGPYVHLR